MRRLAIDCDLRAVYAWDTESGKVCSNAPDVDPVAAHVRANPVDVVLFEIASPVSGARDAVNGNAKNYQLMKWIIFNATQAMRLTMLLPDTKILVAPSNKWTTGFQANARHKLVKATGSNHDLRECECMLWFHSQKPEPWVPLSQYLKEL
jgi:hypothetical protein